MPDTREIPTPLTEELRTQLTGIAQLLESQPDNVKSRANVQNILESTRHLLDLSEPESFAVNPDDLAPDQKNYDVLYIEDDSVNYALVLRIFEKRPDIRLRQATSGGAGVDMALARPPQLILLDLNLPDIHGSEVLRRLQRDATTLNIPVVVISADATPSQIERLLTAGASNYLTKPFNVQKFLAVVDGALRSV